MDMEIARLDNPSSLDMRNGQAFASGTADGSHRQADSGGNDAPQQLPALDWPATLYADETSDSAQDGEGDRYPAMSPGLGED